MPRFSYENKSTIKKYKIICRISDYIMGFIAPGNRSKQIQENHGDTKRCHTKSAVTFGFTYNKCFSFKLCDGSCKILYDVSCNILYDDIQCESDKTKKQNKTKAKQNYRKNIN